MKIKNVHIGQKLKFKKGHALQGEIVKVVEFGEFGEDGYVNFKDSEGNVFWEHCYYLKKYNVGEDEPC